MAKKQMPQTAPAMSRPKPTVRFELPDGLPKNLPDVESTVSLVVRGKLIRVAAKDGDYTGEFPCITVRPDSVVVQGKNGKPGR